ncbi:hypothetical protein [Martelella mangrovi]|uniref:Sulfotransferase family protein n=1 Tax=Martelella mangrovi TaxID=1397477 RepID=A0ABV2I6F9_9HYPH
MAPDKQRLFSMPVIVTGTHYSMNTLMGQILSEAPECHVVHEPLNAQPAVGAEQEHWCVCYDDCCYREVRDRLIGFMFGHSLLTETFSRIGRFQSRSDSLRVGKYGLTNLTLALQPWRAVFKYPFRAFSGYFLQKHNGLAIVLCLRHPCAFAQSLKRRDGGGDVKAEKLTDFLRKGGSFVHKNAKETVEKWRFRLAFEGNSTVLKLSGEKTDIFGYGGTS